MNVDAQTARSAVRDGVTHSFCSEGCRKKFMGGELLSIPSPSSMPPCCASHRPSAAPTAASPDVFHTRPMHAEIEQVGPGACPKYGMDLEPETLTLDAGDHDPELRGMARRLWIAAAPTLPVFLVSMPPMVGVPVDRWLGSTAHAWLQLVLATPVVLWAGWPFFERGFRSFVTGHLNMFTLIAIGTGAEALQRQGRTVMHVAVDGRLTGLIAVSDPIKASTPEAVRSLHDPGHRLVMLTGDSAETARTVAAGLEIDEFRPNPMIAAAVSRAGRRSRRASGRCSTGSRTGSPC